MPDSDGGFTMRIEQLMSREVWTCRLEDSLDRAAQLM